MVHSSPPTGPAEDDAYLSRQDNTRSSRLSRVLGRGNELADDDAVVPPTTNYSWMKTRIEILQTTATCTMRRGFALFLIFCLPYAMLWRYVPAEPSSSSFKSRDRITESKRGEREKKETEKDSERKGKKKSTACDEHIAAFLSSFGCSMAVLLFFGGFVIFFIFFGRFPSFLESASLDVHC